MYAYDCYNYSIHVSSIGTAMITYADFLGHFNGPNGLGDMKMPGFDVPVLKASSNQAAIFLQ